MLQGGSPREAETLLAQKADTATATRETARRRASRIHLSSLRNSRPSYQQGNQGTGGAQRRASRRGAKLAHRKEFARADHGHRHRCPARLSAHFPRRTDANYTARDPANDNAGRGRKIAREGLCSCPPRIDQRILHANEMCRKKAGNGSGPAYPPREFAWEAGKVARDPAPADRMVRKIRHRL